MPVLSILGSIREDLPDPLVGVLSVLAAALCGFLLGFERERKDKPAGLKTIALICVGAAIFTLASFELANERSDVTRIAAQIIPGIGFLGAGAILRERGSVIGLTTAATIWVAAAIGMMVGGGYILAGLTMTLLILLLLVWLGRIELSLMGPLEVRLQLQYRAERGKTLARIRSLLEEHRIDPDLFETDEARGEDCELSLICRPEARRYRRLLGELADLEGVTALHVKEDGGVR